MKNKSANAEIVSKISFLVEENNKLKGLIERAAKDLYGNAIGLRICEYLREGIGLPTLEKNQSAKQAVLDAAEKWVISARGSDEETEACAELEHSVIRARQLDLFVPNA